MRFALPLLVVLLLPLSFIFGQEAPLSGNLDRPTATWEVEELEEALAGEPNDMEDEEENPDNPFATPPPSPTFFGEDIEGTRIVFCLDNSCSMGVPHPWYMDPISPPGGSSGIGASPTRWQAVQNEATSAIAQFTDTFEFDVIIYNSTFHAFFGNLVPGNEGNKVSAISWIWSQTSMGGTNTRPALNMAFNGYTHDLDMLIFLTDGWIPSGVYEDSVANVAAQQRENFKFLVVQIGGSSPNPQMVQLGSIDRAQYIFR